MTAPVCELCFAASTHAGFYIASRSFAGGARLAAGADARHAKSAKWKVKTPLRRHAPQGLVAPARGKRGTPSAGEI
jgi:hypothetical protein